MFKGRVLLVVASSAIAALVTTPLPASATTGLPGSKGAIGYDVSWPQCGSTSNSSTAPTDSAVRNFAIVGVNDGRPNTSNPCRFSEIKNAGLIPVTFYENTANPGPRSSSWPVNQTANGVACPVQKHYVTGTKVYGDCSYVYGYKAAQYAFSLAPATTAGTSQWWLDVESANSWAADTAANIRDLDGAIDFLKVQGLTNGDIGIYTNSSSWSAITASSTHFANNAWWAPGLATGVGNAQAACASPSITGGYIRYVQWVENNFDTNYDCGTPTV